jgi:hypothetical protein
MIEKEFYAHSTDSPDKSNWQSLGEHLEGVARLAEEFADIFGAGDWGGFAGRITFQLSSLTARNNHLILR